MAEVLFIPFLFIAISGITVALFGGWLFVMFAKGVAWTIGSIFAPPTTVWRQRVAMERTCGGCGQSNPAAARFCRRCGKSVIS